MEFPYIQLSNIQFVKDWKIKFYLKYLFAAPLTVLPGGDRTTPTPFHNYPAEFKWYNSKDSEKRSYILHSAVFVKKFPLIEGSRVRN